MYADAYVEYGKSKHCSSFTTFENEKKIYRCFETSYFLVLMLLYLCPEMQNEGKQIFER